MRGIGRSLLGTASFIALVSGTLVMVPSQAPAQFDIGGMVFHAMTHGANGGYSRRHGRIHESSRHGKHSSEDKDARDEGSGGHDNQADAKPERRQYSAPSKEEPQTAASAIPSKSSKGDEPAFTPER